MRELPALSALIVTVGLGLLAATIRTLPTPAPAVTPPAERAWPLTSHMVVSPHVITGDEKYIYLDGELVVTVESAMHPDGPMFRILSVAEKLDGLAGPRGALLLVLRGAPYDDRDLASLLDRTVRSAGYIPVVLRDAALREVVISGEDISLDDRYVSDLGVLFDRLAIRREDDVDMVPLVAVRPVDARPRTLRAVEAAIRAAGYIPVISK